MTRTTKRCPGCGVVKSFSGTSCNGHCAKRVEAGKLPWINELFEKKVLAAFKQRLQRKGGKITLAKLCDAVDSSPAQVKRAISSLTNQGTNILLDGEGFRLSTQVPIGAKHDAPVIKHSMKDYSSSGTWRKFGALGDSHFGSLHERLDVTEALYDIYEREGVTEVFHTGNWIEGEARFNYNDIHIFGLDDQIDYALKVWPQRKGITTYFVAGDDHEGWYQQRTRIIIGKHLVHKAREIGRNDLVYLGYMEGHVELASTKGSAHMLVMHPGGGSAYAESYAAQKIAEAFQEGEKPDIALLGHYHKMNYGIYRGIHCLQTGCGQDQSTFMRKRKIKAAVGGCLVEMHQAPEGHVNRFKPEFFTFFDRGFYVGSDNQRNWLGAQDTAFKF